MLTEDGTLIRVHAQSLNVRDIYVMANGGYVWNNHGGFQLEKPKSLTLIYPKRSYRVPVPKEVPTHIASDFTEACICDGG